MNKSKSQHGNKKKSSPGQISLFEGAETQKTQKRQKTVVSEHMPLSTSNKQSVSQGRHLSSASPKSLQKSIEKKRGEQVELPLEDLVISEFNARHAFIDEEQ